MGNLFLRSADSHCKCQLRLLQLNRMDLVLCYLASMFAAHCCSISKVTGVILFLTFVLGVFVFGLGQSGN